MRTLGIVFRGKVSQLRSLDDGTDDTTDTADTAYDLFERGRDEIVARVPDCREDAYFADLADITDASGDGGRFTRCRLRSLQSLRDRLDESECGFFILSRIRFVHEVSVNSPTSARCLPLASERQRMVFDFSTGGATERAERVGEGGRGLRGRKVDAFAAFAPSDSNVLVIASRGCG